MIPSAPPRGGLGHRRGHHRCHRPQTRRARKCCGTRRGHGRGPAKDDFLAALSHELRTPLSPVAACGQRRRRQSELSDEVRADFATIAKNAQLEARLIDDLLDLTRVTRGK
jgi:signal transduction histidine kinase